MKDTLTYRVSGDSGFERSIRHAKEWIERNMNGPLTLSYSISLKLSPPEGETLAEISKTEPLDFANGESKRKGRVDRSLRSRKDTEDEQRAEE